MMFVLALLSTELAGFIISDLHEPMGIPSWGLNHFSPFATDKQDNLAKNQTSGFWLDGQCFISVSLGTLVQVAQ